MITSSSPYFDYLFEFYPALCSDHADADRTRERNPRRPRQAGRRWGVLAAQLGCAILTAGGLFYLAFPGVLA